MKCNFIFWALAWFNILYRAESSSMHNIKASSNLICFTVKADSSPANTHLFYDSEYEPSLQIILNVDYITNFVEAGIGVIEKGALVQGEHTLHYQHATTDMTHDLIILIDGVPHPFQKSSVPRWSSVSTFKDVTIITGDDVIIHNCKDEEQASHSPDEPFEESFDYIANKVTGSETVTRKTTEERILATERSFPKTGHNSKLSTVALGQAKEQLTNELQYPSIKPTIPVIINPTLRPIPNFQLVNTSGFIINDDTVLLDSSSKECFSSDCSQDDRDFTLAYILAGVMLALTTAAVIISVIFRRKTKRLNRRRESDKLRKSFLDEYKLVERESLYISTV